MFVLCLRLVVGDGGVIKTIFYEGQGWQNPKDSDEVVVHYTARLKPAPTPEEAAAAAAAPKKPQTAAEMGLPVVASSPEGGAVFEVGGAPCSGFAAALKSMKARESALLLLKPECECVCAFVVLRGGLVAFDHLHCALIEVIEAGVGDGAVECRGGGGALLGRYGYAAEHAAS
jgi:hypothetical protein